MWSGLGLVLAGPPTAFAQETRAERNRAQRLSIVTTTGADVALFAARSNDHGAVVTPAGVLLVTVGTAASGDGEPVERGVELHRSDDGGRSWQLAARVDRAGAHDPLLARAPGRELVHLGFSAPTDGHPEFDGAWLRSFDVGQNAWTAEARLLAEGTGGNDQFLFSGLLSTADGDRLVAALTPHRSPHAGWTAWSSSLLIGSGDGDEFGEPLRINVGTTGIAPAPSLAGDVLHLTYRTHGQSYGIHLRSFDLATGSFLQPTDVPLSPGKDQPLEATNVSSNALDANGNLYVLFERGGNAAGQGCLEVVFVPTATDPAQAGRSFATDALRRIRLADDPPRLGGNYNPLDFVLVRGPGELVHAVYALASEQRRRLHVQTFALGQPVGEGRVLAEGAAGAFERISPVEGSRPPGLVMVTVSGRSDDGEGHRVALVAQRWPVERR